MSAEAQAKIFEDRDLPLIFHAADKSSLTGQSRYLTAVGIRLICLVAAAAFGLMTLKTETISADWAGVLAAVSFFTAAIVELYLLRTRPDQTWYQGRAAAESVRTLSWRYAVGGAPFAIGIKSERDIEAVFLQQIEEILKVLGDLHVMPPDSIGNQITAPMISLRSASLQERKRIYEQ